MKYLILIPLFLMNFNCSSVKTTNNWDVLTYEYESGPLPPKYQYSYKIIINSNGNCEYIYTFPMEGTKTFEYKFSITSEQMKKLNESIAKSKILEINIPTLPEGKRPIGGDLEKVKIIVPNPNPNLDQPPKVYESPYFPEEKYKKDLEELYSYIKSLVPETYKKETKQKHEEFIKE
ncbi:MAG: hypothetical protein N2490_00405 [Ignavibacteria bacterium]|nr:hypothetical protein [Ignavibacteria bacterium]